MLLVPVAIQHSHYRSGAPIRRLGAELDLVRSPKIKRSIAKTVYKTLEPLRPELEASIAGIILSAALQARQCGAFTRAMDPSWSRRMAIQPAPELTLMDTRRVDRLREQWRKGVAHQWRATRVVWKPCIICCKSVPGDT